MKDYHAASIQGFFFIFFLFLINPYYTETYTEHVQFKDNAKSRFVLMIF